MDKSRQFRLIRIARRVISEGAKVLMPVNRILTNRTIRSCEGRLQPIFIIGAPRTGSTLLYQIITYVFRVSYISNFIALFHHSLYLGFLLNEILFGERSNNSFKSWHGLTNGLHSPNECGQFWYNWLPSDKHYVSKGSVAENAIKSIRSNIFAISSKYQRPLVFKNMNAGLRMGIISEIAPNSKFILIDRDPLFTSQSILIVRKMLYGDYCKWWSLMPKNYPELRGLEFCEQVVKQIYYVKKQIHIDSVFFPGNNIMKTNYNELCSFPEQIIERLHTFLGMDVKLRRNLVLPEFALNNRQTLGNDIFLKLQAEIEKLDWNDYTS